MTLQVTDGSLLLQMLLQRKPCYPNDAALWEAFVSQVMLLRVSLNF